MEIFVFNKVEFHKIYEVANVCYFHLIKKQRQRGM